MDKYRFNGSTWARSGYVDVEGATGLVADVQGAAVSLAVTTPTQLLTLSDPNGADAAFAPSATTVLATAACRHRVPWRRARPDRRPCRRPWPATRSPPASTPGRTSG